MPSAALSLMPMLANAFFSQPMAYYTDLYDWPSSFRMATRSYDLDVPQTPRWTSTNDHYVMRFQIPDVELDSLSATLVAGESALTLEGKRKFEGCECAKRVVGNVPLPYRPREEDIELVLGNDKNTLELKLARQARASPATPIKIKVQAEEPEVKSVEGTRPIRFVPHASATATAEKSAEATLQEKEKTVTEKFAAALAASSRAAKETMSETAASPEGNGQENHPASERAANSTAETPATDA